MYKVSLRVNIVVCLLFIYSHAEVAHKRLPMGFQGMRGKKSVDLFSIDDSEMENPTSLTRLQNYLMTQQPDHFYPSYKRAPMGFVGMRGKKDFGFVEEDYEFDPEEKRGLRGFQGMRGKKQVEYPILSYPNKRKPMMGFQGMRGKKNGIDELLHVYEESLKNGNIPSYGSSYYANDYSADDYEKRGGLRGFQGMRGKREFDHLEQDKRVPSGFMGMRGKKDDAEYKPQQTGEDDAEYKPQQTGEDDPTEDSTNQNGMKEVAATTVLPASNIISQFPDLDNFGNGDGTSDIMGLHAVKRSTNYGFFGVRGKKMPYFTSYFGTRGKKGPFENTFRGKFVGVRGKKSDAFQQYTDRLLWAEEYQKRRGPSGFVGMRGKKSITPDDANILDDSDGAEE